jgi:DNA-binding transcriptional regulator YiaG
MSENKKRKTMIFTGLGFPIRLINAPMRKVYGKWAFDFSMGIFQEKVLHLLAIKSTPLTGPELRFIIDYFRLSYRDFAALFSVSHAAVVKWEKETSKMNPNTEIALRLYILDHLKVSDKEFRKRYSEFSQHNPSTCEMDKSTLNIDLDQIAC